MAYPLFTKIDRNIYNNILTHSTGNANIVNKPTYASGLFCWVRLISGTGNGLIFYSNPSIPNFGEFSNPQFNQNQQLISITQTASNYGNRNSSGMIGFDWNGNPIFPYLTPITGDLTLRPRPLITGLQIKEGKDQISRHCEVSIKCFSLAQAEILQTYLMEPGHCINVEFGWNTDNSFSTMVDTSDSNNLASVIANRNLDYDVLQAIRETSGGDYESFFGFIVGGSMSSEGDNYLLTVKLRGMPGLPTFLQTQHTILELKKEYDKDGKFNKNTITDVPSKNTYPVVDIEVGSFAGTFEQKMSERRFKWMFNKLPGNRQTPEVQTLVKSATDTSKNLGWYNFINFDYKVYNEMRSYLAGNFITGVKEFFGAKEFQVGGLVIPKEKLLSENRYINFGLALDILNSNNGLMSYNIGGKEVTVRINTRAFIGAFPGIFSTRPDKLVIPGSIPNFYQFYCNPNSVSTDNILKEAFIDNAIYGDLMVWDSKLGKEVVKRGPISFVQSEAIPPTGTDLKTYNGFHEVSGYYGKLEHLYINFDLFKKTLTNSYNKTIRDVLMEMLNEMSAAVNSFWNFQLIEQQIDNKITLQIIDENWSGYLPDEDRVRNFYHNGEQSVFLEADLDINIPSEMTNQIILKRESIMSDGTQLSYTSNPNSQGIDVGGLFSKNKDKFLVSIDKIKVSSGAGGADDKNKKEEEPNTPESIQAQIDAIIKSLKKKTNTTLDPGESRWRYILDLISSAGSNADIIQYYNANGDEVRTIVSGATTFSKPYVTTNEATAEGAELVRLEKLKEAADNTTKTNQETALSTNLEKIDVVPNPAINIIDASTLKPDAGFVEFNKNYRIYCCEDTQLFDVLKNNAFESYPGAKRTSHLLPIKYKFKILGKSGIRRGDTFNIIGIPKKYRDYGFFQIVEVDHILENNSWYTEVTGQYRQNYKLKS
jgi:hypothetical protein